MLSGRYKGCFRVKLEIKFYIEKRSEGFGRLIDLPQLLRAGHFPQQQQTFVVITKQNKYIYIIKHENI